jgi:hypothetical protein
MKCRETMGPIKNLQDSECKSTLYAATEVNHFKASSVQLAWDGKGAGNTKERRLASAIRTESTQAWNDEMTYEVVEYLQ